jgi:hypothetical protein
MNSVLEFAEGEVFQAAGMRSIRITAKANSATPKIEKADVLADRLRG